MVDASWLSFSGFPFLGSRLRTTLVTIPTHLGHGAWLHMPRCVGQTVTGAAQDLGSVLRLLLPPGSIGGLPLGAARLASARGGVEGL